MAHNLHTYPNCIQYEGGATFVRICSKCGRYVKADIEVFVNDETGLKDQPNATCKRCARTTMIFLGFI